MESTFEYVVAGQDALGRPFQTAWHGATCGNFRDDLVVERGGHHTLRIADEPLDRVARRDHAEVGNGRRQRSDRARLVGQAVGGQL